jgi:hypothetical protein
MHVAMKKLRDEFKDLKHKLSRSDICSVCCNLEPHRAPKKDPRTVTGWAEWEFRTAQDSYSVEVAVDDPKQLVQGAEAGCVYCRLVCDSLSSVRPEWTKGASYVDLMLGENLPVTLRLGSGDRNRVRVDRAVKWRHVGAMDMVAVTVHKSWNEMEECPEDEEYELYRPHPSQSVLDNSTAFFPPSGSWVRKNTLTDLSLCSFGRAAARSSPSRVCTREAVPD